MSRRSRRRRHSNNKTSTLLHTHVQRDIFIPIARPSAAHILQLEDRRRFEPVDTFPRAQFHRSARLVVGDNVNKNKGKTRKSSVPSTIKFAVPQEVAVCVRRKQRREVLFAMRRTGKGSKRKDRRRTYFSDVSCR